MLKRSSSADQFVISFPKSGRTWHRVMVGHYLAQLCGWPADRSLELGALCDLTGIGQLSYSHNGAATIDDTNYNAPSVADPSLWKGKPVLLIVRDPRDVLVSLYHHIKYRDQAFPGEISEFIRSSVYGIDKVLTALNRWSSNRHLADRFEAISYEHMHRNPFEALRETIAFIGLEPQIDKIHAAVQFASFENMQAYEAQNFFGQERMTKKGDAQKGAKVREGKIGSYKDHLSDDDIFYIAERARLFGDPFSHLYG